MEETSLPSLLELAFYSCAFLPAFLPHRGAHSLVGDRESRQI